MKEKTDDDARQPEHAAVDELLPWYVNETLSAGERARVLRHLDECGACRDSVSLLLRVDSVVNRPMATPILPPRRPARLLEQVDRLQRCGRRSFSGAAMGAAASVAIVAATLLLLLPDREAGVSEPPVYETATSASRPLTMDYVMSLEFERGVARGDRLRVLRELDAADIRGGGVSGAYQVNITLAATSLDELERFTSTVEDRPEVRSARIVAVQLPMQREPTRDGQ